MRRWLMAVGSVILASHLVGCAAHTQPDELFQLKPESAAKQRRLLLLLC